MTSGRVGVIAVLGAGLLALVLGWLALGPSFPSTEPAPRERMVRPPADSPIPAPPTEPQTGPSRAEPDATRQAPAPPAPAPDEVEPMPATDDGKALPLVPEHAVRGPFPMDLDGIREAIDSQRAELTDCYETLLQSYPDVQGTMKVSFHVDADGRVLDAQIVDDETASLYMRGCLTTALEDLRFEPGGGGDVTYPFRFANHD